MVTNPPVKSSATLTATEDKLIVLVVLHEQAILSLLGLLTSEWPSDAITGYAFAHAERQRDRGVQEALRAAVRN